MLLAVLTFALLAPGQAPAPAVNDSVAVRKFIARVRREEERFLDAWRREWQKWRDLSSTDPRYFSIHCHFDEPLHLREQYHLIRTPHSRKSMCPIWFQGQGMRGDEAAQIDNGLPPRSRAAIRARRASVLRLLDSAAALAPRDPWVLGQRVRLLVDQGEHQRALAIASSECAIPGATCPLLEGYVLASGGHRVAAAVTFEYALTRMDASERCRFLDIAAFVPYRERDAYDRTSCEDRAGANGNFWWLADPLFSVPGNERLAVHLHRHIMIALRSALTADEHFDYRIRYGGAAAAEMLLRYGWPNVSYYNRREDENHDGWLGWSDAAANSSREYFRPRYHLTPSYEVARDLTRLDAADLADVVPQWNERGHIVDERWWPMEHIERPGPIVPLDYQVAALRRRMAPLVAVATDPRARNIAADRLPAYTAALVSMRGPGDNPRHVAEPARLRAGGGVLMAMETVPGWQVLSGELVDGADDTAPAARARFPLVVPPGLDSLRAADVAISDPLLFTLTLDGSLPSAPEVALERMLPTTSLTDPQRLGVYFELYGLDSASMTDLALTIISLDQPGLLRRLGSRMGIAESAGGAIGVRWRGNHPGTASSRVRVDGAAIDTRAIVLNVALLRPGRYVLEIAMESGGQPVVARREFQVRR